MRELISNASDALDKIRLLSLTNEDALAANEELTVKIKVCSLDHHHSVKALGLSVLKLQNGGVASGVILHCKAVQILAVKQIVRASFKVDPPHVKLSMMFVVQAILSVNGKKMTPPPPPFSSFPVGQGEEHASHH